MESTTGGYPKPTSSKVNIPWKKWWFWLIVGFVALVVIGALSPSDQQSSSTQPAVQPQAQAPQPKPQAQAPTHETTPPPQAAKPETTAPATPQAATPEITAGQENALQSAEDYLSFTAFSRAGLVQQLSSSAGEGFSKADATYAADHVDVDWNEQAVKSAQEYLSYTSFSRSGLIQQLSSSAGEGFTRAQAEYAVNKVYGG